MNIQQMLDHYDDLSDAALIQLARISVPGPADKPTSDLSQRQKLVLALAERLEMRQEPTRDETAEFMVFVSHCRTMREYAQRRGWPMPDF